MGDMLYMGTCKRRTYKYLITILTLWLEGVIPINYAFSILRSVETEKSELVMRIIESFRLSSEKNENIYKRMWRESERKRRKYETRYVRKEREKYEKLRIISKEITIERLKERIRKEENKVIKEEKEEERRRIEENMEQEWRIEEKDGYFKIEEKEKKINIEIEKRKIKIKAIQKELEKEERELEKNKKEKKRIWRGTVKSRKIEEGKEEKTRKIRCGIMYG